MLDIRRICTASACLTLSCVVAFAMSGCRETDVLKELINDQSSENIDYDNPSKYYNNTPDAELTSEDYPQMEESKKASIERERKNANAVNGKDEVDDEVSENESNDETKGDSSGNDEDKQEDSSSDNPKKTDKKKRGGEGGDSADSKKKGKGEKGSGGAGGEGTTVDLSGDKEPEQGKYDKVAAFGECANIVLMLAGKDSLVASDSSFVTSSFAKKAYASQGIDEVAKVSTKNDITFNVKQVIKAKPEALFVADDTYEVSSSQKKQLKAADIDVVYLPNMKSHTSIVNLVRIVGTLFGNSSQTLSGQDAKQKAQDYKDWVSDQVKSVTKKNGGLTTYGGLNYDTGKVDTSKSATDDVSKINWTLFINEWDDSATYTASPNKSYLWKEKGVALAKTGYTWSPISYYMSVGGVNNNAAQFHVTATHPTSLYYVWQFNLSYMSTASSHFSGVTVTPSKLENFNDDDLLVRTQDSSKSYSLGCDNFRNVIVSSQKIQKAFTKARDEGTKKQQGLYAAYDYQSKHGQTGIGLFANGNVLVHSYIGYVDGTKGTVGTKKSTAYERYKNGENPYEIIVNPHGLYSDWAEGSIESVLECSWIYDLYHDDSDYSGAKNTVKEFYKTFYYDYELTDDELDTIFDGAEE